MKVSAADDSLLVDISDALSERDRVRFTVHTRTKLPQFAKPVLSVVRQHEEFIWLHDCLEDNDQYAGYIIPPAPPRPDFDASRDKLQRLGDGEANMTKEEFAKVKQELEAEYLAIFKKTVAMHEVFLQRLAAHEKFRQDSNFKIFLEYENELAVRCKSKKERLAGSIQNIGKSLTDFVITTSQVAAATSASTSLMINSQNNQSPSKHSPSTSSSALGNRYQHHQQLPQQQQQQQQQTLRKSSEQLNNGNTLPLPGSSGDDDDETTRTDSSVGASSSGASASSPFAAGQATARQANLSKTDPGDGNNNQQQAAANDKRNNIDVEQDSNDDIDEQYFEKERLFLALYHNSIRETAIQADKVTQAQKCVAESYLYIAQQLVKLASIEVVPITSRTLLNVSDYLEQARKIETRIASDEDLKLTDTFLYYKRDTVAAQDLLMRRLRFMSEFETATRNLEKNRQKGRTQMQYADVIQKQAKENFISISKLAKKELIDYKQRRVASFRKAFADLVELELKHLRSHSQLIKNCLNTCRDMAEQPAVQRAPQIDVNRSGTSASSSRVDSS